MTECSIDELVNLAFDTAYYWKMSPRDAMTMTPSELFRFANQFARIMERYGSN